MIRKIILFSCLILLMQFVGAQKLSIPDLRKIKTLNKNERGKYLQEKQYVAAQTNTDGGNSAITYRSQVLENNKVIVRSLILLDSKELKSTMLEYSTYDEQESKLLREWLLMNGYKQTKQMVGGREMLFFTSKNGFIRFFEEPYELTNGITGNRSTFSIEN